MVATAQSQTTMRRTVVLTEAGCGEDSGCEDGDALDARCPFGLNALGMTGGLVLTEHRSVGTIWQRLSCAARFKTKFFPQPVMATPGGSPPPGGI